MKAGSIDILADLNEWPFKVEWEKKKSLQQEGSYSEDGDESKKMYFY